MSKEEILFNILMFLVAYLIVFIVTFLLNKHKLKSKKKKEIGEINYLTKKFNLDSKKLNVKGMLVWISIIDAFIISFVGTFIIIIPVSFIWQILIGFVMLFGLIYALFEIYGRHLVNKGLQKGSK